MCNGTVAGTHEVTVTHNLLIELKAHPAEVSLFSVTRPLYSAEVRLVLKSEQLCSPWGIWHCLQTCQCLHLEVGRTAGINKNYVRRSPYGLVHTVTCPQVILTSKEKSLWTGAYCDMSTSHTQGLLELCEEKSLWTVHTVTCPQDSGTSTVTCPQVILLLECGADCDMSLWTGVHCECLLRDFLWTGAYCDMSTSHTQGLLELCKEKSLWTGAYCDVPLVPCDMSLWTGAHCDMSLWTGAHCDMSLWTGAHCDMSLWTGAHCDMSLWTGAHCDMSLCDMSLCDMSLCDM
ncbi:hypothetical protein STEG23_032208 [Scotinomys teguina]